MRRRTALGAFSLLFLTVCPTDARQHVEAEPEPALESPNHPWWKALEAELAQSTVAQSARSALIVDHTGRITLLAIEMIASGMEPAAAARRAATELGPDTSSGAQMLVLSSEPSAVAERSIPGVSPQKPTALFPNATLPGTSIRDSP